MCLTEYEAAGPAECEALGRRLQALGRRLQALGRRLQAPLGVSADLLGYMYMCTIMLIFHIYSANHSTSWKTMHTQNPSYFTEDFLFVLPDGAFVT